MNPDQALFVIRELWWIRFYIGLLLAIMAVWCAIAATAVALQLRVRRLRRYGFKP